MRVRAAAITAAACGVNGDCSSCMLDPKPSPEQHQTAHLTTFKMKLKGSHQDQGQCAARKLKGAADEQTFHTAPKQHARYQDLTVATRWPRSMNTRLPETALFYLRCAAPGSWQRCALRTKQAATRHAASSMLFGGWLAGQGGTQEERCCALPRPGNAAEVAQFACWQPMRPWLWIWTIKTGECGLEAAA